jgi:PAS domain S-box-containing protein
MLASPIVKGIIINYRDITERKKIEKAIKENEEKYRNIIENLTDVYYRADENGLITMISPSAINMFKAKTIDEIIGYQIENIYKNKEDREKFILKIKKYGKVKNFKTILYRSDNT